MEAIKTSWTGIKKVHTKLITVLTTKQYLIVLKEKELKTIKELIHLIQVEWKLQHTENL